jgi:tRNA U34 5-carboxymethylaminomethyl modifying enzyme MnmG/GidA
MKQCLDCNRDISEKGNRSIRCDVCQVKHRNRYKKKSDRLSHDKWNNEHGTTRRTKELNQWANQYGLNKDQILTISQQYMQDLITCYRNQLKGATGREALNIKTKIKILDDNYISNELKETIKEVDHENAILPHTERINWDKAKTGWTNYYDDGLVTLSPKVFFGKWKVDK